MAVVEGAAERVPGGWVEWCRWRQQWGGGKGVDRGRKAGMRETAVVAAGVGRVGDRGGEGVDDGCCGVAWVESAGGGGEGLCGVSGQRVVIIISSERTAPPPLVPLSSSFFSGAVPRVPPSYVAPAAARDTGDARQRVLAVRRLTSARVRSRTGGVVVLCDSAGMLWWEPRWELVWAWARRQRGREAQTRTGQGSFLLTQNLRWGGGTARRRRRTQRCAPRSGGSGEKLRKEGNMGGYIFALEGRWKRGEGPVARGGW